MNRNEKCLCWAIGCLYLLAALLVAVAVKAEPAQNPPTNQFEAELTKVLDCDTLSLDVRVLPGFVLADVRVRIRGINAPETRGRERALGLKCVSWLKRWLPRELRLTKLKSAKYFGRVVADVILPETGNLLADVLIADGYALPYTATGRRPKFDPTQPYPLETSAIGPQGLRLAWLE
jgi:endonuclease YncB( thermonuclease family)